MVLCQVMYGLKSSIMGCVPIFTACNEVGAKVMFLHMSVILFMGGGVVSKHTLAVASQHALQQVSRGGVSRSTPRGELRGLAWGVSSPTPGGVSRPTPWGRGIPACTEAETSHGYCCGRYASYWNAFLFAIAWTEKITQYLMPYKSHVSLHLDNVV